MDNVPTRLAKFSEIPSMDNYYTKDEIDRLFEENIPQEPLIEGSLVKGNTVRFDGRYWIVIHTVPSKNEVYLQLNEPLGYETYMYDYTTNDPKSYSELWNNMYMKNQLSDFQNSLSEKALDLIIEKQYQYYYSGIPSDAKVVPKMKIGTYSTKGDPETFIDIVLGSDFTAYDIDFNYMKYNKNLSLLSFASDRCLPYCLTCTFGVYRLGTYHYNGNSGDPKVDTLPICCILLDTPTN